MATRSLKSARSKQNRKNSSDPPPFWGLVTSQVVRFSRAEDPLTTSNSLKYEYLAPYRHQISQPHG